MKLSKAAVVMVVAHFLAGLIIHEQAKVRDLTTEFCVFLEGRRSTKNLLTAPGRLPKLPVK